MAATIPSSEPTGPLVAGTSWEWDRHIDDYPPSAGWALAYYVNGPVNLTINATTSSSGDWFEVRQAYAASATLTAGTYVLAGYVTKGTARHEVYRDTLEVEASVAGASATQDEDEAALVAIKAAMAAWSGEKAEVEIAGRKVVYHTWDDLRKARSFYEDRLRVKKNPSAFFRTAKAHCVPAV